MASPIPYMAERVTVSGHDGRFFVVTIDLIAQTVDLIPAAGTKPPLCGVPFSELRRVS